MTEEVLTSEDDDVLFLGTGIMGTPMARRLAQAGRRVHAWNRTPGKAAALAPSGVLPLADLRALEPARRIAIIMVSTGDVADELIFGRAAGRPLTEVLSPESVVVVMSSIPVGHARAQAARLAMLDIFYLDAPVSGGEVGAVAGTLTVMAGGDAKALAAITPLLTAVGNVTHVGPAGSGSLAKLANQMIVGITIGAVGEALALAELGGADIVAVAEALQGGFADSQVLRLHGARMIAGDFVPGAHVTTQIKDLATAEAFARQQGASFPQLSLCADLFRQLERHGRGGLDHSALYLDARARAGLPTGKDGES